MAAAVLRLRRRRLPSKQFTIFAHTAKQTAHTYTPTHTVVGVYVLTSTESGSQHRFHCTDKPIDDVFFTLPSRLAPPSLLPLCTFLLTYIWASMKHTVQWQRQRQRQRQRQHWFVLSKSFASCRQFVILAGAKALPVRALSLSHAS